MILTNITKFSIFNLDLEEFDITGVKMIEWKDSDPWKKIPIPYGPLVQQQIIPSTVTVKITCYDYESLTVALSDSGAYDFETMLRTIMPYCQATAVEDDGTVVTFQFNNIHIETLEVNKLTEKIGEAELVCQLHADNAFQLGAS
jgi:hypothetical protein